MTKCRRKQPITAVNVSFGIAVLIGSSNSIALGEPIAVANPGFEADPVSTGCFAVFQPTGWLEFDPNNVLASGGNVLGGVNCAGGSPWFPGGAPEGEHAGIVFLSDQIGSGPAGYRQVLAATLAPNTTYTLTVQVGNIASGTGPPPCDVFGFFNLDNFPGYRVELWAGTERIAHDDNALFGLIDDGEFGLSTCTATIDSAHTQLGANLEIRLINLNAAQAPEAPGIEVDFDDVQLTAVAVFGDFDGDGDVDLSDFAQFSLCFGGPNVPPAGSCPPGVDADFDDDGDVDLSDFATFSLNFTGPL